jgi:hypothetical protein
MKGLGKPAAPRRVASFGDLNMETVSLSSRIPGGSSGEGAECLVSAASLPRHGKAQEVASYQPSGNSVIRGNSFDAGLPRGGCVENDL